MLRRPGRGSVEGAVAAPASAAGAGSAARPATGFGRGAASQQRPTAAHRCGIRPDMTPEQVRQHLATLYRRHNRAAASLNPEVRAEANEMLDAIIEVRKSLGN